MGSLAGSIFMFFLWCVVPLGIGLLVVLGIRGLPAFGRGIQSVVRMDGANFIRTDTGNIQIRKRTFFVWLVIAFCGLFELGLIAVIAYGWSRMTRTEDASQLFGVGTAMLLVGSVLFLNIRLLGRPSVIEVDASSRTMTLGKGMGEQQLLFSQLSEVLGLRRGEVIGIYIKLNDERVIEIGSVSGASAKSRAVAIVQQIAEVTGAKIRES